MHELKMSYRQGTTIWVGLVCVVVETRIPLHDLPITFFNTEWLISKKDKELSEKVEAGWFKPNDVVFDNLYLEAFAWHWHNSSKKHLTIEDGSKFALLQKITQMRLEERGIV